MALPPHFHSLSVIDQSVASFIHYHYEIFHVENRKVNAYGHVYFRYNHYSVPHELAGKTLSVRFNGALLKVYDGLQEVALHQISTKQGE